MCISVAAASSLPESPKPDGEMAGEQIEAVTAMPPSTEVNTVQESEIARKMQQAQKAENAKEYDAYGGGISIIAMCIVIGALIVLSILFMIFGKISSWFLSHKKKQTAKNLVSPTSSQHEVDDSPDMGVAIAAISIALAQHFSADHDMQDTILTIRKLRKAYSPWNSKIYNMRHQPEVAHTHKKLGDR